MNTSFDKIWEDIHSQYEWGQYPSEEIIRFIARNYYKTERSNTKILDFCCGGGCHTWYLCREGFDVYAFDGSESAIKNTVDKLKREFNGGVGAKLKVSDALALEYPENFFDAVIDSCGIYANKIEDIKRMYQSVYYFLKPGGKLMTVVFSKDTTGYGTGIMLEKDTYTDLSCGALSERGTVHFFDKAEIKEILIQAGFRDIMIDEKVRTQFNGKERIGNLLVTAMK